jgi:hypothetical protein
VSCTRQQASEYMALVNSWTYKSFVVRTVVVRHRIVPLQQDMCVHISIDVCVCVVCC